MPKPPPLSPIADIFERDSQIASWTARLKQEQALTDIIRRLVPRPLALRVRVAEVRGNVLELAVAAGAVATVVRQRTPDMTMALRREGWDFTEIRIRVQARAAERRPEKKPLNQVDTNGVRALFHLADNLPDSPLKESLARWKRRARGR
ncbi:MAG TPA: DciA family protein [Casimicrobiaceae bacterium]